MPGNFTDQTEYKNGRYVLQYLCSNNLNELARRIGRYPQQVGAMLNEHPTRSLGARMARHIEEAFNLPNNWLSMERSESEAAAYLTGAVVPTPPKHETAETPRRDLREAAPIAPYNTRATTIPHQLNDPSGYIEHMLRISCAKLKSLNFTVFSMVPYDIGPRFVYTALAGQNADKQHWFTVGVYDRAQPKFTEIRLLASYERVEQRIDDGVVTGLTAQPTPAGVGFAAELKSSGMITMDYIHIIVVQVTLYKNGQSDTGYTLTLAADDPYQQMDIINYLQTQTYPPDHCDENILRAFGV